MPEDTKYGHVTLERGTIPDDEPIVVFRARDPHLVQLLYDYERYCREHGSPEGHLQLIADTAETVMQWGLANGCETPTSAWFIGGPDDHRET